MHKSTSQYLQYSQNKASNENDNSSEKNSSNEDANMNRAQNKNDKFRRPSNINNILQHIASHPEELKNVAETSFNVFKVSN